MAALKLIVLSLVAIGLAQAVDWPYLDQVALALVGLLMVSYAWSRLSVGRLAVVRKSASDQLQVGQTFVERITIRNNGRFAKLWLESQDYSSMPDHGASRVVNIRGRATTTWTVRTPCLRRGRFRIGPLQIASGDPFGLFPASLRVPGSHHLLVYPATVDLSRFPLPTGRLTAGATRRKRTQFVTPSVGGVREYAPGDAFSRISWTASARQSRLMVKEFDLDPTSDLWVVLDFDRANHREIGGAAARPLAAPWLTSTQEYGVTIAASLCLRGLSEGLNVGLIVSAARPIALMPERGARQDRRILEPLATVAADGVRPLAEVLLAERLRWRDQCTVVVITPSIDERWVEALAEIGGRRGRTAAIVLEGATFGLADAPMLVVGALAAANIPAHLVKYGDDISIALSGQIRGASDGATRGSVRG